MVKAIGRIDEYDEYKSNIHPLNIQVLSSIHRLEEYTIPIPHSNDGDNRPSCLQIDIRVSNHGKAW
jgi:hypothetical protein